MKLYHRTNYWGTPITATENDDEVDFPAIWVQAIPTHDHGRKGCCFGFGKRGVPVLSEDLTDGDRWCLWEVSGTEGRKADEHFFWKFALVPKGANGYGRRGCENRGWTSVGEVDPENAEDDLEDLLVGEYSTPDDDVLQHLHIGIMMDVLDAPRKKYLRSYYYYGGVADTHHRNTPESEARHAVDSFRSVIQTIPKRFISL